MKSARRENGSTQTWLVLLAVGVLSIGFVIFAGPAAASEDATRTPGNFTVSESVIESNAPDPDSDRLGWEHGVWANATLSIDQSDGINQAELEAVVARTMARVESVRGIEFDRTPPVRVLFQDQQRSETANRTVSDAERTRLNAVYEALFTINESRDAVDSRRVLFGSGVNGYYSPATGNVTMISPNSSVRQIREGVLAQELFHAQQDTQFDLPGAGTIEERNTRNSYVEGDANYVQQLYEQRCSGAWSGTCYRPDRSSAPDLSGLNEGMSRLFQQPYQSGYAFVRDRHQQQGWEAVNRLYDQPPASTEQVIHPEKYGQDRPQALQISDRSGDSWEPLTTTADRRVTASVGEPGLYVSLLYPTLQTAGQVQIIPQQNHFVGGFGDAVSLGYDHPATAGWDGDRLLPYVATDSNATGYVFETAWDTPADAREFHEAYRTLLAYHDANPVPGLADTYRIPESDGFTDAFYVNRTGDRLRIVNAPSIDALSEIRTGAGPPSNASQPATPWERTDLQWETDPGTEALSSPTVSEDRVVVHGRDGTVLGVDSETGELAWTRQVNGSFRSSSTVSDGSVYVGTLESTVTKLDAATGERQWTRQASGAVVSAPAVVDGTVYAGTATGRIHAIDAATGDQEWTHGLNGTAVSPPVVADGSVLVGSRAGISALDAATGDPEWRAEFSGNPITRPVVAAGTVYAGAVEQETGASRIHAIDLATGEERWTHEPNGTATFNAVLTVTGGTVYTATFDADTDTGTLFALAGDSGDRQWTLDVNGSINRSPVVSNDTVFVGSSAEQLYAIEAATGERRWTAATEGAVNPPIVVTNGTLYVGDRGGQLSARNAATGTERWRLLADGLASVEPAVANGTVYATGGPTLYAVQAPSVPAENASAEAPGRDDPDSGDGDPDSGDTDDTSDGDPDATGTPDGTPTAGGSGDDGTDGDSGDTDTPDGTPDATQTAGGNGDDDTGSTDQESTDTPAAGDDGPGFGVLVALLALVGVVVVALLATVSRSR